MTDSTKAQVWAATWQAWGGSYAITGPQANDMRFPGQWFQLESGLHYNWHRHYDPSIGRYTQPDPLGFVDGPSVFGYVGGVPQSAVDPDGRLRPPTTPRSPTFPPPTMGPTIPDPPADPPGRSSGDNSAGDRQMEYERYTEICRMPPPVNLTKCDLARWKLRKAKICYKLRGAWDESFQPDRHKEDQENTQKAMKNLEDYIRRHCEQTACYAR